MCVLLTSMVMSAWLSSSVVDSADVAWLCSLLMDINDDDEDDSDDYDDGGELAVAKGELSGSVIV